MDPKLQKKLYKAYPELFKQRKMDMTQTAMVWGCECGDGWFELINSTCAKLSLIAKASGISISFTQVKEKYGTLRMYMHIEYPFKVTKDTKVWMDLIDDIEDYVDVKSGRICDVCGEYGDIDEKESWLKCRCKLHKRD